MVYGRGGLQEHLLEVALLLAVRLGDEVSAEGVVEVGGELAARTPVLAHLAAVVLEVRVDRRLELVAPPAAGTLEQALPVLRNLLPELHHRVWNRKRKPSIKQRATPTKNLS